MTESEHLDVGAYALGVLDDRDSALFEEHLAGCFSCAGELESLLPVVDLLSDVDSDDLVTTERATSDPYLLDRLLTTVAEDRRRARSRRMYSLAAGFVLVAMLTGLALFAGARWMGDTEYTARPGPSVSGGTASPDSPDTGFGGPELPAGERLSALDGGTGVKAEMMLESKPFGTQVSFALSRLSGPRTCRMVVLRKSGSAEVISSWNVPDSGYGTDARPAPLLLQAATAVPRADIREIQVQAIGSDGVATPLVTVPA